MIKIMNWRPLRKNSLCGSVKVQLPSGMIVSDITVLMGKQGPGYRRRPSR
jgi:hypothetical protein